MASVPKFKRVTEERHEDMLNILPPAGGGFGAFLVGEPHDHCPETGEPRFSMHLKHGTDFIESTEPVTIGMFQMILRNRPPLKIED